MQNLSYFHPIPIFFGFKQPLNTKCSTLIHIFTWTGWNWMSMSIFAAIEKEIKRAQRFKCMYCKQVIIRGEAPTYLYFYLIGTHKCFRIYQIYLNAQQKGNTKWL